MTATLASAPAPASVAENRTAVRPAAEKRSVARLLGPLDRIADASRHLVSKSLGQFESSGVSYSLPRYLYVGPRSGGDIIRIGIFATIHGDEPEGALALGRLLAALDQKPELAQGYALFIYPVCNPTGFEDNTRHARSGKDLNREFWKQSDQPEVRFLESEIWMQAFHGIITLHSDDTSDGLYGYVKGAVLSKNLLDPALIEAGRFLPRNHREVIDGFPARSGIIHDGYPGMLQSIPDLPYPPFEITLETPQKAPLHRQVDALVAALQTILVEYRYLQAVAQNI
jgi:protein MpaA